MKRSIAVCIVVIGFLNTPEIFGRVFFTGSNPALSSIVFPQDNLLVPGGDRITFGTTWQNFPWWGDIDDPENKPYNEYIFSGERGEGQQYNAAINQFDHTVGFSRWLEEKKKLKFDLRYSARKMTAEANGFFDGVPYSFKEQSAIRELYLLTAYATYMKNHPVGIRVGIGGVNTSKPQIEHLRLNGDAVTATDAVLWGWKEDGNRIQQEFNTGNPLKFDLQAAGTFDRHKVGTRFRFYAGKMNRYHGFDETTGYEVDPMKIYNYTFRLYGIYNWFKRSKFRFNTTALTRYTVLDTLEVVSDDPNIQGYRARAKQFVFQVNPNVNIFPWKYPMAYIDAAILCNYQYTRYDYLVGSGRYISTNLWEGSIEDLTSHSFSYGNEHFAEAALDVYAVIPIFGMKNQMAALGVSVLVWRRYKWFTKYYGGMSGNEFEIRKYRKNFDREMWLNSVINLVYRRGKFMYRLDFGQPLIYSLSPRTIVYNADGTVSGSLAKGKMWLAQSGYRVGFFVSTDLENVMKYQPFARPY